jgi:hypothetical protein
MFYRISPIIILLTVNIGFAADSTNIQPTPSKPTTKVTQIFKTEPEPVNNLIYFNIPWPYDPPYVYKWPNIPSDWNCHSVFTKQPTLNIGFVICSKVRLDNKDRNEFGVYYTYTANGVPHEKYLQTNGALTACILMNGSSNVAEMTQVVRGLGSFYYQGDKTGTGHPTDPYYCACQGAKGGGVVITLTDWQPGTLPNPLPKAGDSVNRPYMISCDKWM